MRDDVPCPSRKITVIMDGRKTVEQRWREGRAIPDEEKENEGSWPKRFDARHTRRKWIVT